MLCSKVICVISNVGYVPGGYELYDRLAYDSMISETYFDAAGKTIDVTLYDRDASINVNSENAEQTIVKVNNETGYIFNINFQEPSRL